MFLKVLCLEIQEVRQKRKVAETPSACSTASFASRNLDIFISSQPRSNSFFFLRQPHLNYEIQSLAMKRLLHDYG
jgi:hypothetical protein